MPVYEVACRNAECVSRDRVRETYLGSWSRPDPACPECGIQTERLFSRFASPFTGDFSTKYNDSKLEGAHAEGHWVTRKKTLSGQPEQEYITSWAQQKQYCKDEGLVNPKDVGNWEVSDDGRGLQTAGVKGQWTGTLNEKTLAGFGGTLAAKEESAWI